MKNNLNEELNRFKAINRYVAKLINEQEDALPPADAAGAELPPPDDAGAELPPPDAMPPDAMPPDTEMPQIDPEADSTEEIDITDLVNMTKSIKKTLETNNDVSNKMNDVFTKLDDLSAKIEQMDQIFNKIDELGAKVEKMKPETPQEKLEMRSLDSYPFNQKPNDFFQQKQAEMKASGKHEYVLTKSDITNYGDETLKNTFNVDDQDQEQQGFNF